MTGQNKFLSFYFILFSLCGTLERQNPPDGKIFFLVD